MYNGVGKGDGDGGGGGGGDGRRCDSFRAEHT